jgi:hypothetical protein
VKDLSNGPNNNASRRRFLKNSMAAGTATVGTAVLGSGGRAFADDKKNQGNNGGKLSRGDAALLRFAAAAEIIESDFWIQYNELGGIQDAQVPGGSGNPAYTAALEVLDSDFPQYVHDNTDDEITHFTFLNAYLASKGAATISLEPFRTLKGSNATGSSGMPRLTNLMQLTLDTSWWTRYRSRTNNPDLDPSFVFPQAVPGLAKGQFTAIPRTDADLSPGDHLQAIANTAGFHMPTIEQGGSSLYPSMAQRANDVEVLRILISIGPTETMHFQTWHDKAGNAPPLTDPTNGLVFPDLNSPPLGGEQFSTNLIMPEPCPFISRNLPVCSVIRPTETKGIAMGVVNFLTAMGLFIGQTPAFFEQMKDLAAEADQAKRDGN